MDRFNVARIEPLVLTAPDRVTSAALMSPYVWPLGVGRLGLLVRAVTGDGSTGSLWCGEGTDGLSFHLEDVPSWRLDPTRSTARDARTRPSSCMAAASSSLHRRRPRRRGRLLWASGPDIRLLAKHGVALGSFDGEQDVKEAEISVRDGH